MKNSNQVPCLDYALSFHLIPSNYCNVKYYENYRNPSFYSKSGKRGKNVQNLCAYLFI